MSFSLSEAQSSRCATKELQRKQLTTSENANFCASKQQMKSKGKQIGKTTANKMRG